MADVCRFNTNEFFDRLEGASLEMLHAIHEAANEQASRLYNEVHSAYPRGKTGNLRAGVKVVEYTPRRMYGSFAQQIGARVRSDAKHVHFIEHGHLAGPGRGNQRGQVRKMRDGWYRFVAARKMPKGTSVIFVPAAIKARARFYRQVETILAQPRRID